MPTEANELSQPRDGRPLSRRRLLALAAATAAVAVAGCGDRETAETSAKTANRPATSPATNPAADESVFDAGPLDDFGEAKVYGAHRDDGFFVIRRGGELTALSSVCTHKGCLVSPQSDGSYKCKCHGSLFSPEGRVLKGPAKRDLPRLAVKLGDGRRVLVDVDRELENPA